ncbi:lytic polysaccharide monooxygenase [Xylariaceae sp. AK1471]|nr:lytic polysaccharide monooxygenase [Xylariaceae sp. AK1471]
MKYTLLIQFATLLSSVRAHYLFGRLILNGRWTETWEYVREVQARPDSSPDVAMTYPQTNPDSVDLRCGRNASDFRGTVKTATVQAGDMVGIAAGEPKLEGSHMDTSHTYATQRFRAPGGCGDLKPWMYHPGFASAWLSKAPTDNLNAYTGDGNWFKILSVTNRTEQSLDFSDPWAAQFYDRLKALWGTYRLDSYNFTIPEATPPGKYLLRFEHIFPNKDDAQFYVNCAQIEIVNPNANFGTPGPVVKIPGVYTRGQPDVYFSSYDFALAHNYSIDAFVAPAPVVWTS